jgi:hypothetical protein
MAKKKRDPSTYNRGKKPPRKKDVWLKHYLDETSPAFLSPTEAARLTFPASSYKENSLRAIGSKLKAEWEPEIKRWMDEEGLSEERLKKKIIQLLEAKETKFFQHEGVVTDQRDVDALGVQLKATELGCRVMGHFQPQEHRVKGSVDHQHGFDPSPWDQVAEAMLEMFKQQSGDKEDTDG